MLRTVAVAIWAIANLAVVVESGNRAEGFVYCNNDVECSENNQCYKNALSICTYPSLEAAAEDNSSSLLICTESSSCGSTQQCSVANIGICISDEQAASTVDRTNVMTFCSDDTKCTGTEVCLPYSVGWCLPIGVQWIDPASIDSIISCHGDEDCPWSNQTCHFYQLGACIPECLAEARELRDMSRRIDIYQIAFGEPVVSDHKIAEQWYSLGKYRLAGTASNLTTRSCGSTYPVGLSDGLSVDWEALDMNEVSITATVFGRPAGFSEELEIRVRKCEDDIQYYLKPTKIPMSAYCFESLDKNLSSTDGTEAPSIDSQLSIEVSLHFKQEYRGDVLYDVPYVEWNCNLAVYFYDILIFPEIQYITLSWFADNNRILWSGRTHITDVLSEVQATGVWKAAQLTEDDLINADYTLGVIIQCGVQVSVSELGKLSQMTKTSFDTKLFLVKDHSSLALNDDSNCLIHYNIVPLGCAAPQGTIVESCTLTLHAVDDNSVSECSKVIVQGVEVHELCGVTIVGLTKHGLEMRSNVYSALELIYQKRFEDGKETVDLFGTHIKLDSSTGQLENDSSIYLSMAVLDNPAGHRLWDNFISWNNEVPLSVGKVPDSGWSGCSIGQKSVNDQTTLVISRSNDEEIYVAIAVQDTGKYIMLWSGTFPFSTEIDVESNENGLYVCGATIRYGNDIYTYSFCGGIYSVGLIAGDGSYMPDITDIVYFKHLSLQMFPSVESSQISIKFTQHSGEANRLEGFCAFGTNAMVARDGNKYNDNADFLQSWRIDYEDSLNNPANQVPVEMHSNFHKCGCPKNTEDIPENIVVADTEQLRGEIHFTGAFVCNLDTFCTHSTTGNKWKTTLLPEYVIEQVDVEIEQNTDPNGESVLLFICQFESVPWYQYKVQWIVDDLLLKEIGPVGATNRNEFTITDEEMYDTLGSNFYLDIKIQCSVSALDADMNVLISPVFSGNFYPIHVTSDQVNFQRGGDGVVSFISNIPFKCTGSNTNCDMEIRFYDPNDSYDCENSTLAIKSADSCGGRVTATSTIPAVKGTETRTIITTKNNDKYDLRDNFELHAIIVFHGTGKLYWTGRLRTVISVMIEDQIFWLRQSCHLHVDPHSRSMDGRNYENQNEDLFVVLRHKTLPIEIQTLTTPCWIRWGGWSPTCSCAFILRAGADVYLINHCDNKHFTGFLSAGDKIIQVYERSDTRYEIFLPNTMRVDINIFPEFDYAMNIDIYPSPMEKHNIEGLCGDFNGDPNDDMKIRGTTQQGHNNDFSLSWGLIGTDRWTESLLNKANYENPSPWNTDEKLCVCPDATLTNSNPICSVNEEQTCTISKNHKGRMLNTETRHKRDAEYTDLDIERRLDHLRSLIFGQHAYYRKRRSTVTNVFNETYARTLCEEAFVACPVKNISGKPIEEDAYIDDCTKDVAASGTTEWAHAHCDALTTRMEIAIEKDVVYAQNNLEVVEEMEKICVGNCNGHGTCLDGICQCDGGWALPNCLLEVSKPVEITYITGDGRCDLNASSCEDVVLETSGLVAEPQAKVSVMEARTDGIFKHVEEFIKPASRLNFNEAVVGVSGGRRRRAISDNPVLANQYGISVSNDGVNFGNFTYVTVLDSRCQETANDSNGETVVLLKAGFCYIDGICVSEGTVSAASSCKLCRAAMDLFDWTKESCPSESSDEDTSIPTYLIVIAACAGLVLIILVFGLIVLRFSCKIRSVRPVPTSPSPAPSYDSPRTEGPMNKRFSSKQEADAEIGRKGKE